MIKRSIVILIIFLLVGFDGLTWAGFRHLKIGRLWHSIEDGGGMNWYNSNHLAGRYPFIWPAPRSLANPFLEKALGATPVAMNPGEVYLALDKGVVDGTSSDFEINESRRFYEITKSCNHRCWQDKIWGTL